MSTVTNFGIVYATGSKMIRRVIVPDRDVEDISGHAGPGESLLICPIGPHDLYTCQALVEQATGVKPANHVCAVVNDAGDTVHFIHADPDIDRHPNGRLVIVR